ncbi:hypothetical protein [Stieleria sedimenti]|uniref:hypothetical protein n=1 Tax=Stieleria sedimenti TaxID=2976331 RepID=UPI00217F85DC|nr:hypothetical protein [Stieleria sedimenti]
MTAMEDPTPIDHKDSDLDYRRQVWKAVAQRVGSELTPMGKGADLTGEWVVEFEMFGSRRPMTKYHFLGDNQLDVVRSENQAEIRDRTNFEVVSDGRVLTCEECFHGAMTEGGEFVLFNGDSSVVMVGTNIR